MLLLGLNRDFREYVPVNIPFPQQVMQFVVVANSKGWISELVQAVLGDRPNNQSIRDFLSKYPHWDPTNH